MRRKQGLSKPIWRARCVNATTNRLNLKKQTKTKKHQRQKFSRCVNNFWQGNQLLTRALRTSCYKANVNIWMCDRLRTCIAYGVARWGRCRSWLPPTLVGFVPAGVFPPVWLPACVPKFTREIPRTSNGNDAINGFINWERWVRA